MYYLTAATDLVRLTGNQAVKAAVNRPWRDMVDRKMYITGGLGFVRQWEGFGYPFVIDDTEEGGTCYAETCATFGLIVWCQRLLRMDRNTDHGDVMEIDLYNGFLGAVGLDGKTFYYDNPLRTFTDHPKERSRWFQVACCPPNGATLLGNLGAYIFSTDEDYVFIHLYIASEFRIPDSDAVISVKTDIPWTGEVEMTWTGNISLAIRIPGWSKGGSKPVSRVALSRTDIYTCQRAATDVSISHLI